MLTKADIEKLAKEVRAWASRNKLGKDWSLFYNGKRLSYPLYCDDDGHYKYKRLPEIEEADPIDYCEWFSDEFIMGLSVDGTMWSCINGYERERAYAKLEVILNNYGLYLEHCDSCHCEFVNLNNDEVEYYKPERKQIIRLLRPGKCVYDRTWDDATYPKELDGVMLFWRSEAAKVGDIGACTIGEYLQFDYKGDTYRMSSQSPYQGDQSWYIPLPKVKEMLKGMGADNMYMNYGRLD